jgi:glycosyltransferase involved in cell wall biosynthesis
MRVLIVTNMYPTRARPEFGVFVRDQLEALCRIDGVDAELFALTPGRSGYMRGVRELRNHIKSRHYDVVHAHYGLTGWVANLAGARPLMVTYHGTDLRHEKVGPWSKRLAKRVDQASVVSEDLGRELAGIKLRRPLEIAPVGVNLERATPMPRDRARAALGLDPERNFILFPADPARPEKRHDRAVVLLKEFSDVELLTLGGVEPTEVSAWYSAADAVLIPSEYEGFGLAALESIACGTPVIATPTGIATEALKGLPNAYCVDFDLGVWRDTLASLFDSPGTTVPGGRERAARYSTDAMAQRLVAIYERLVGAADDA